MDNEIRVSIICTAYNHEKYIRNALSGFVMQVTNFSYEVLINDDASTDKTASIIREYESRYPDIIKPIYQNDNQFSQGINISRDILMPSAKGKYIAFCEGDDYWIDPLKLQKQYDFMEDNPEYVACYHNGIVFRPRYNSVSITPQIIQDREYSIEEIIKAPDGNFITSSTFIRKEYAFIAPEFLKTSGFLDVQELIHSSTKGKVMCLRDTMSIYVCGSCGSWTERIIENNEEHLKHYLFMVDLYKKMDEYYNNMYHDAFLYKEEWEMYNYYLLSNNKKMLRKEPYKTIAIEAKGKLPLKLRLVRRFPFVISIKQKMLMK